MNVNLYGSRMQQGRGSFSTISYVDDDYALHSIIETRWKRSTALLLVLTICADFGMSVVRRIMISIVRFNANRVERAQWPSSVTCVCWVGRVRIRYGASWIFVQNERAISEVAVTLLQVRRTIRSEAEGGNCKRLLNTVWNRNSMLIVVEIVACFVANRKR